MLTTLADTITPLMAADFGYLFLINAVVGILEALLLKRWFGGGKRAVWWMILANYLSAWIGWMALLWLLDPALHDLLGPSPIERINLLAAGIALGSFVVTIVIEVGFVHRAIDPARRSFGRSLFAAICVNAVSYALICGWFLWTSFSLPLNAHVASLSAMGRFPGGTLYWVSPAGKLIARNLNGDERDRKITDLPHTEYFDPDSLRIERAADPGRVQLAVRYREIFDGSRPPPAGLDRPNTILLADAGSASALPADYWERRGFMQVPDLRPVARRQMQVHFAPYRHYLNTKVPGGPHSHLCVGLATIDWPLQNPTILPDDKIVFDWDDQIVVFDPRTQKIAYVAAGTCPTFIPGGR